MISMNDVIIKDAHLKRVTDITKAIKNIRKQLPSEESYGISSLGVDYPTWINMMIQRYMESAHNSDDCVTLIKDLICAEADCEAKIHLANEYGFIKNKKIFSDIFIVRKKLIALGQELKIIKPKKREQ